MPRGFILWWRGKPRLRVASFGFEFTAQFSAHRHGARLGSWTVLWGGMA